MRHLNIWMLPGSLLMGLAWLLPNTYQPWLSAWQEAAAMISVLMFGIAAWQLIRYQKFPVPVTLSFTSAIMVLLVLFSLGFQTATGVIFFSGDAVMVLAYFLAWLLAVLSGKILARLGTENIDVFLFAILGFTVISIGLALVQWLGIEGLNIFVLDMPPGGRPFANFGQPNNFCTLCFLGCASLLYFHERGTVRGASFWLAWCWLSFGMALSQSRTGWVQMACLVLGLWWLGRRVNLRLTRYGLIGLGGVLVVWVTVLPLLASGLLIGLGRTLSEQMQGGVRGQYWLSMLSAIIHRPWIGYGWLQTGLAQQLENSGNFNAGVFDFSHNIVLDLIIWTGLPLGIAIVSCAFIWLMRAWRSLNNGASVIIFFAIFGILIHAMLEYPLAYAYFLIPFGFLMGILRGLSHSDGAWILGRRSMAALILGLASFFALLANDYFSAEMAIRDLRFESARISPQTEAVKLPDMLLLTQVQALMHYGYRDPEPDVSEEALMQTGLVAKRYGFSFALFNYALSSAFRGDYAASQEALKILCRIHPAEKCRNARFKWELLSERHRQSLGMVEFPGGIFPVEKIYR